MWKGKGKFLRDLCVFGIYLGIHVYSTNMCGEGSICCVCSSVRHLGVRVRVLLLLLGRGVGRTEKLRIKIRGRR